MSDLVVPIIFCFQTQKQLPTLNNIWVLLKSILIDYVHIILCMWKPPCMHVACTLVTMHAICWALLIYKNILIWRKGHHSWTELCFAFFQGKVVNSDQLNIMQYVVLVVSCHVVLHIQLLSHWILSNVVSR